MKPLILKVAVNKPVISPSLTLGVMSVIKPLTAGWMTATIIPRTKAAAKKTNERELSSAIAANAIDAITKPTAMTFVLPKETAISAKKNEKRKGKFIKAKSKEISIRPKFKETACNGIRNKTIA